MIDNETKDRAAKRYQSNPNAHDVMVMFANAVLATGGMAVEHARTHLAKRVENFDDGFCSVELRRGGNAVSLYLQDDFGGDFITDDEGNVWSRKRYRVGVNWSAHGTQPAALAISYATLIADAAKIAADFESEYSGKTSKGYVYNLCQTSEEVADARSIRELLDRRRAMTSLVRMNVKHLRVGSVRVIGGGEETNLRDGESFDIESHDGKRSYTACCRGANIEIKRVS